MSTDDDSGDGGHCSTPDSDGEVAEEIAVVSFERKLPVARDIEDELADDYDTIDIVEYHGDVFAEHWGEYDCFVGLMAAGIAMRKTAGLLDDKWDDPAVVVVDEELTWAIPLTGGHHGANQVANDLSKTGAVPAMTTASEAAGKQGIESKAKALDAHVVNGDSTVATNLAVLNDEIDAGVVLFEKETLLDHEGPTPSRAKELIGWPGIAEAAAIAGGREHELAREKERFDEAVTVAVGR